MPGSGVPGSCVASELCSLHLCGPFVHTWKQGKKGGGHSLDPACAAPPHTNGGRGAHGDQVHAVPPSLRCTLFCAIGVGKGRKWGRCRLCTLGKEGGEGGQSTPTLFCSCSTHMREWETRGREGGGHAPLHSPSPPPDGCMPPCSPFPTCPSCSALPFPAHQGRAALPCPPSPCSP
jgi:hypothetical protein